MRQLVTVAFAAVLAASALSCSTSPEAANTLGGDPNVPAAAVGNEVSFGSIKVGQDNIAEQRLRSRDSRAQRVPVHVEVA